MQCQHARLIAEFDNVHDVDGNFCFCGIAISSLSWTMNLSGLLKLAVFGLWVSFVSATNSFNPDSDVLFLLRIRDRPFIEEEIFTVQTADKVAGSAFDPKKPTTFVIHGYMEDRKVEHHLKLSK